MDEVVRDGRAALSEGSRWTPTSWSGAHAAHVLNLADEACEEALLDGTALRRFVGVDPGRERVPDGTTLLKFRRLLERNKLGEQLFAKVGKVLQGRGLKVGTGTTVDATIIGAPSSTKNADKARDPEMHASRTARPGSTSRVMVRAAVRPRARIAEIVGSSLPQCRRYRSLRLQMQPGPNPPVPTDRRSGVTSWRPRTGPCASTGCNPTTG